MLPPDVQAAVRAVLREENDPARVTDAGKLDRPSAPTPAPSASPPPYLFVVRAGEVLAFNSLRTLTRARPDLLGVLFDRRWREERRGSRLATAVERRRADRRRPMMAASWVEHGFVLVSSLRPSPEPGTAWPPRVDEARERGAASLEPGRPGAPAPSAETTRQPADSGVTVTAPAPSSSVPGIAVASPVAPRRQATVAAPVMSTSVPLPAANSASAANPRRDPAESSAPVPATISPVTTVAGAWPVGAGRQPARPGARHPVPKPARPSSAVGPPRRSRHAQVVVGRLRLGLVLGGVVVASFYLLGPGHLGELDEQGPGIERVSAPDATVERPPPPAPASPASRFEDTPPAAPSPSSPPARRDRRAAAAPAARAEPPAGSGAAAKPCIAPAWPAIAVQDGVLLGALVEAKPDATSRPPRCLYVVKRADGSLRVVDAARVEARSGFDGLASRAASEK
jgi:hypothetical protein